LALAFQGLDKGGMHIAEKKDVAGGERTELDAERLALREQEEKNLAIKRNGKRQGGCLAPP